MWSLHYSGVYVACISESVTVFDPCHYTDVIADQFVNLNPTH